MHIALVVGSGIILMGLFTLFGWLWGASTVAMSLGAKLFIPFWLVMAGVNMWVGVTHAGYSVREEFPIMLLVFAVPAIAAGFAIWRLSHA